MKQIANADARPYVARREPFKGNNLWGECRMTQGVLSTHDYVDWEDSSELYVVCSYGVHYPMWIYDFLTGQWFGDYDTPHWGVVKVYGTHSWSNHYNYEVRARAGTMTREEANAAAKAARESDARCLASDAAWDDYMSW